MENEPRCFNCGALIEFPQNVLCPECWAAASNDELEALREGGII